MGRAFEVRKASMAKTGLAKTKLYTKFSKEIYMAAKNGIPDPESNLNLKHIIEKAKKESVPADVIKRAVDKAKGADGVDYQHVRYEGFGPDGSTIIVDCLTDNVNRTVSEVKNCFTKTGCKMGVSGSVAHLYDNLGIIEIKDLDEDSAMEVLINADVDLVDIESDDNQLTLYVQAADLHKAVEALKANNEENEIITQEIAMLPQIESTLNDEDLSTFEKLLDKLNEVDDVQEVYHSVMNI